MVASTTDRSGAEPSGPRNQRERSHEVRHRERPAAAIRRTASSSVRTPARRRGRTRFRAFALTHTGRPPVAREQRRNPTVALPGVERVAPDRAVMNIRHATLDREFGGRMARRATPRPETVRFTRPRRGMPSVDRHERRASARSRPPPRIPLLSGVSAARPPWRASRVATSTTRSTCAVVRAARRNRITRSGASQKNTRPSRSACHSLGAIPTRHRASAAGGIGAWSLRVTPGASVSRAAR